MTDPAIVHFTLYPADRTGPSPYPCGAPASEWGAVGVRYVPGCHTCVVAARKEHEARKAARSRRPRRVRVISPLAALVGRGR